jgi:hypothetical protein
MNSFAPLFAKATVAPELLRFPNFVATFPSGYQSLWTEIARHLDVRLNSPVTKVVRQRTESGAMRVLVTAGGRTAAFDRLVISSPLDQALSFLDASSAERDLFARIRTYPFTVTVFKGKNLPRQAMLFLEHQTTRVGIGHVTAFGNQHVDRDIWTAGQLGSWSMDRATMERTLRQDMAAMGGDVESIITQRLWSYFPHVSTADLDAGFYQRLDKMQGRAATYYVGGIMNFESVEHTARFARELMLREF